MSVGPIPWSKIVEYARHYGLEDDVVEAFVDIIREMDVAYLNYNSTEQKRISDMNKPKGHKR